MILLIVLLLAASAVIIALSIPALRAVRRVDVTVRTVSPLFRGPLLQQKPTPPTTATAARLFASRLVGSEAASSPEPQLFSLPGPSPALAPFVLAGWLRGAVSGPAMFCTLLFGGARQMLPTAAEGEAAGGEAATTPTSPWLAGDVALLQKEEAVRIQARTLSSRWLPLFRDVDARVLFEREEKQGDEATGAAAAATTTLLLRARCEATVRGVPALLEGAARAAVEQAHARLCRDVATELMRAAAFSAGGGDGWAAVS
jgi:hypothetical protein